MFTWILRIVWFALSAFLVTRIYESLFSHDQTTSIFPFASAIGEVDVAFLVAGVFWGLLLTFGLFSNSIGSALRSTSPGPGSGPAQIAPGTIVEVRRTGLTVNDVPQYEIFLEIEPIDGEPFVSSLKQLVDAAEAAHLQPGGLLAVSYSEANRDRIALADPQSREVEQMMLRWRISHGLILPELIAARTRGVSQPASVLALRPTGERKAGQVQVTARLLVMPTDGTDQFEADSTIFLHPEALSRVQVGSPVFAMYEPSRPDLVHMTIQRQETLA
ncbi:hypothetical protein GCM10010922_04380 [Microbacterium sorbitolivorans]|uniref:Uncharacterized protein n=1 Tax=Microbacterium sorbitolivorans TaxID=1867410 RepID=A0A367Y6B9_9MICO|nr:hypothetical protein [Microbacterium sorbitolivorans]RCK61413.1 hypothetical protein DTO57_01855 [Microbacterium sorbitolivorans]GGF32395.1 hypothetical protein GCM10010922_04380 [Microbacterium sorbitolivorans]